MSHNTHNISATCTTLGSWGRTVKLGNSKLLDSEQKLLLINLSGWHFENLLDKAIVR